MADGASDPVPLPRTLLARIAAFGVDVPELLRRAGLGPSPFAAPQPVITAREHFALWRAIAELTPTRDIGLRFEAEAELSQLNLATLAALQAPTLGEALGRLGRYKRLVCAEELSVEVARGEVRLGFRWIHVAEPLPPLLVEVVFAAVLDLVRRGSGERLVPRRVELSRRRADVALLQGHFGCPLVFDAPADRLVLDESALARRFRAPDTGLHALLSPALAAVLAGSPRPRSPGDDVRAALRRRLTGAPVKIEHVAADLRLTPRTLQRRLARAGTSYQALLDEVRHDTARHLLAATDLGPAEIAFLLGFAELNSFTRAFRSREKTTPLRWRQARMDGPGGDGRLTGS
ncbi:MAG: AraC family transcriptional regulator [Myxococcales bacterium]|nr:MAG: AraC family transcriptional regulator [Myxococcales bacterium]